MNSEKWNISLLEREMVLNSTSDVTKALDAETEAKTEAGGFETEAVAPETEAQGSWTILFAVQSSVTTTCL